MPIPGGRTRVGTDAPFFYADGEGPARSVTVKPFGLGATTVTNAQFAAFVAQTQYLTDAEKYGWSYVFYRDVRDDPEHHLRVVGAEWWRQIKGAMWSSPEGPGSDIAARLEHPVVHVSHNDAQAYARWCGGRLPSEVEWEHAAKGGLADAKFPWGDTEPGDEGPFPCNIWQGAFPLDNSAADGFRGTAPGQSFQPNGYGLYNMCGNVWEWCSDQFRIRSLARSAREANSMAERERRVVQKGGSFLCHKSYCYRYRIAARIGNTRDTSTSHCGFRIAHD